MARLSRTSKYADLRNQMSQDRETSVYTEELGKYEDKLKGIQNNAGVNNEEILRRAGVTQTYNQQNVGNIYGTPVSQIAPEPQVMTQPEPQVQPQPEPVQPANNGFVQNEANSDFFDFLNSLDANNLEKDINKSIESIPEQPAPSYNQNQPFENTTKINTIPSEQPNVVYTTPQQVINNNFMNDAIKEANDYNRNDGRKTIDELSTSMVDAVRHPEGNGLANNNDEFSNTVSLEIDKVLSEIKSDNTPKVEQPVKENINVTPNNVNVTPNNVNVAKEEEVVEIKSMEETLKQDVLDDTIPFVMNNETEVVDEYEDDAPNKILNVILVVLIVILLAILGVIVYYILYAKGIIG